MRLTPQCCKGKVTDESKCTRSVFSHSYEAEEWKVAREAALHCGQAHEGSVLSLDAQAEILFPGCFLRYDCEFGQTRGQASVARL